MSKGIALFTHLEQGFNRTKKGSYFLQLRLGAQHLVELSALLCSDQIRVAYSTTRNVTNMGKNGQLNCYDSVDKNEDT